MTPSPDLVQQQLLLMDLIYENELERMMGLVPTFSTLDFVAPSSADTPLTLAVGTAEEEVIEYLLLHGADPNFASKQTLPLLTAIERSVETDKYWSDAGDATGEEAPLLIVELLLNYGANCLKKDPRGESAYEFALKEKHPSWRIFERLMHEAGTDEPS